MEEQQQKPSDTSMNAAESTENVSVPGQEEKQVNENVRAQNGQVQQNAQVQAEPQVPEVLKKAASQPNVTSEEKIWALISYLPLLALMALVLKPSSEYMKLHGRQGLLIFLIFFFNIFVYLVPYIGPVIGVIIHLATIAVALFSMYQAFIGNWWKIPVLGDIAELIPVDLFAKVTREAVMGEKVSEEIEQKSMEEEEAKIESAQESTQPETTQDHVEPIQNEQYANVERSESQDERPAEVKNQGESQQQLPIAEEEGEQPKENNQK